MASELILNANDTIGLNVSNFSGINDLILDSANIYSLDSQPDKVDSLNLSSLTIRNSGSTTTQMLSANENSSLLNIDSDNVKFESGNYFVNGYNEVQIVASNDILFNGDIKLSTNTSRIELDTPLLYSETASSVIIDSQDADLHLLNSSNANVISNSSSSIPYGFTN